MPTSLAERRHSLSLVGLAALQGFTQPASAHEIEQLDLVTTTPTKDKCFLLYCMARSSRRSQQPFTW